jgi:ribose-phosphate pyrophosphokinase
LVGKTVQGYTNAIVYDDEISTGSSVVELSHVLRRSGVEEISVVCTHGVFVGNAIEKLDAIDEISEIITSDTVAIPEEHRTDKLITLSVAPIFARALEHNFNRQSIGELFVYGQ